MKTFQKCVEEAEALCHNFSIRVTKVIRATMEEVQTILDNNKQCSDHLKIIHLLRDPRGKTNSHLHLPDEPFRLLTNYTAIQNTVTRFCARILQDIRKRRDLEEKYPDSFLELRYENVADDLLDNTMKVYDFVLGQKPPSFVLSWVKVVMGGSDPSASETYNIKRENSSATARQWRQQLPKDVVEHVETHCKELMNYLNLDFLYLRQK